MGSPRSYLFEVICSFERGNLRISLILQRVEVHLGTHSLPWRDFPDLCIYTGILCVIEFEADKLR